jgi:hypothetical protein
MQQFIEKLREMLKQTAQRANDTLKTLPPLEQYEKTTPIYAAIQNTGYALDFIERTAKDLNGQLDAIDPEAALKALGDAQVEEGLKSGDLLRKSDLEAKITAGELMRKEDAQTAANKAADDREKMVRDRLKTVETRRKEVSTPKGDQPALLSAELAARIPSEVLEADDYLDKVKKVAARVKDLNDLGVEVPQLLTAAVETPVDEKGEAQFTERLSLVKDVAGKASGKGEHVSAPEPFAHSGVSKESEDLVAVF